MKLAIMEEEEPVVEKLEIELNGDPEEEEEGEDQEAGADFAELDSNANEDDLEMEESVTSEDVATDDEELDDLQKESDIPLDALMSLYGSGRDINSDSNRDSILDSCFSEDDAADKDQSPSNENGVDSESSLDNIPLVRRIKPSTTLQLLSSLNTTRPHAEPESYDDLDDEDYVPTMPIENWKKNVQVGEAFQVIIPDLNCPDTYSRSHDSLATQLWNPRRLDTDEVDTYLINVRRTELAETDESSLPNPVLYRDNEQALYSLLQNDYHPDAALHKPAPLYAPLSETVKPWTEEECAAFEGGLRLHGKNFFNMQANKLPERSVGELVQFYYFWKKTERREVFCNRGKREKRSPVTPGITDYTSRFHRENHVKSPDSAIHICECSSGDTSSEMKSSPVKEITEPINNTPGRTSSGTGPTGAKSSNDIQSALPTALVRIGKAEISMSELTRNNLLKTNDLGHTNSKSELTARKKTELTVRKKTDTSDDNIEGAANVYKTTTESVLL